MGYPRIVLCAAAVAISDTLNIECGTEQSEGPSTKHPLYLIKDLDGSATKHSVDLQGQYVSVFAHIYEPVRSTQLLTSQSHGPYSTHACVARYFVDGTPPQSGHAACNKLHLSFNAAPHSCRGLPIPPPQKLPGQVDAFSQQAA
jgi:hypothetical protein